MNNNIKYFTRLLRKKTEEEKAFIMFPKIYPEVIKSCSYATFNEQIRYNNLENRMKAVASQPHLHDPEQHAILSDILLDYLRRPRIIFKSGVERNEDEQIAFEVFLKKSAEVRTEDKIFYDIFIRNQYRYEHVVTAATCANEYLDKVIALFHNPEEVCEEKSDRLIRRKLNLSPTEPLDTYALKQKEAMKIKLLHTAMEDMLRIPPKFISAGVISARTKFIENFNVTTREYFENPGILRDKSETTDRLEEYIMTLLNWHCDTEGARISMLIKRVEEANSKVVRKTGPITREKLTNPNDLVPAH